MNTPPDGWKAIPLGDLLEVQSGYAFKSKQFSDTTGMPLIRIRDLKDGGQTTKRFTGEYDSNYVVTRGDLLIGMDGEFRCYEWDGPDSLLNQRVCRLINFADSLEPRFLLYGINHFLKQIEDVTTFTTVKHLSSKKIKAIEFPLPPLSEQRRIVSVLDAAFASLATATANTQKNLQNARELFDSCLNTAFEDEPEDWLRKPLADLTTKIGSGATPRGGKSAYKTEGISLIRSMNVHDAEFREKNLAFIDDEQASKLSHVQIEADDVLLNITGASVARCCNAPEHILPAVVNQHVSIIRPKPEMLDSDFLQLALISKPHKDRLLGIGDAGATRQAITKGQIKAYEIAFPAQVDEQLKLVNHLRLMHTEVERLAEIATRKLAALSELKQSILHRAFRGELSGDGSTIKHSAEVS